MTTALYHFGVRQPGCRFFGVSLGAIVKAGTRLPHSTRLLCLLLAAYVWPVSLFANSQISGRVVDMNGGAVVGAHEKLQSISGDFVRQTESDARGVFTFASVADGKFQVTAYKEQFAAVTKEVIVSGSSSVEVTLQFQQLAQIVQAITVSATEPSALAPDPSQRVVAHDQVLDANPGRPGAPISLPGLPVETASGGIKAPQYFAPGVAGDHGEPIAQFFQIGNLLLPNNLPANAHGNGYADPNFLVTPVIEAVTVNGGAFNVREGNHSVDLASVYVPRRRLNTFVQLTGGYRDIDLAGGWSPSNPSTDAWVALEVGYGNGFLERLEHRQQYKLNGLRGFKRGQHELTVFGTAYHGFSFLPGLIPIHTAVPNDTIDEHQLERTSNFLMALTDTWTASSESQLSLSAFVRAYDLTLRSNFGPDFTQQPAIGGLIQQSESRNVVGGGPLYTQKIRPWLSFLAGVDLRRDAPRGLDLRRADTNGNLRLLTSNDLTLSFVEPFAAIDGAPSRFVHYDLGIRREEIWMDNTDKLDPAKSFNGQGGITLPKATITLIPADHFLLPTASFSYGEAFHTEDPRIGNGTGVPQMLSAARAYQLVLEKAVAKTELRLTLRHVTKAQELAEIDPDTGLQEDVGPSLNRSLTLSLQRTFSQGSILISYSQADARDRVTGTAVPEAPRFIWDTNATANRLPYQLRARGEIEYVRAKPLGDGFVGVDVPEFRGAVLRPFADGRMTLSTEFLITRGYTGQTTETFALPTDSNYPTPVERVVGVPLRSYISLSWSYRFGR